MCSYDKILVNVAVYVIPGYVCVCVCVCRVPVPVYSAPHTHTHAHTPKQ
jgi:hypothetical protein